MLDMVLGLPQRILDAFWGSSDEEPDDDRIQLVIPPGSYSTSQLPGLAVRRAKARIIAGGVAPGRMIFVQLPGCFARSATTFKQVVGGVERAARAEADVKYVGGVSNPSGDQVMFIARPNEIPDPELTTPELED